MVTKIVTWTDDTVSMALLSKLFTEFYKDSPWDEYLHCPKCQRADDFGPDYVYGFEEVKEKQLQRCPICGTKLELFWSENRLQYYLFELNKMGEVIFIDGQLAAWWRGRMSDEKTLYLDVIAILPEFRRPPYREITVGYFQKEIERFHREDGINCFLSRTHKRAVHVQRFLKIFGFIEDKTSTDDPNRSYWAIDF